MAGGLVKTASVINLSAGGGNGFAAPDIFPGDGSPFWDLVGASNTIRSGLLQNDSNGAFLVAGGSTFEVGTGLNGKNVARHDFTSGGEAGAQCSLHLPSPVKKVHVSCFYNTDVSSLNIVKMCRFWDTDHTVILNTPALYFSGLEVISNWDQWGVIQSANVDITPGVTNHFEWMIDMGSASALIQRTWLNGVLVIDDIRDFHASSPDPAALSIGWVQWDGTMNTCGANGTVKMFGFAVSSQRIGVPTGYTVPS